MFNPFGLIFVIIILIPNAIFALKCKDGFKNSFHNKFIETSESIGRFGCFIFMFLNLPGTYSGFPSERAFYLYLAVNSILAFSYCLVWAVSFNKSSVFRSLALSVLPSLMFIFSGLVTRSLLLTVFSFIFAPCHIIISYKNAKS